MSDFGYAGEILRVDLSTGSVTKLKTSDYAQRFVGGRGIAAKIYWDETDASTRALEPENCLIFTSGPLAGFTRIAGSRWTVCGKSPEMDPESFSYASLGGSFGVWLKYAGYDGVVFVGKADRPAYLCIDNGDVQIKDAAHLWGKSTFDTEEALRNAMGRETRVAVIGPAGENLVPFAIVLASDNSSGSSGFGAVMGSKNLKAVAVKVNEKKIPVAAELEKLKALPERIFALRTKNREAPSGPPLGPEMKQSACFGCISGCSRVFYEAEDGKRFKFFCQASGVYREPAVKHYGPAEGLTVAKWATRLCDSYGLDTAVLAPLVTWLKLCYEAGILTEAETGLPLSQIGSREFFQTMIDLIAFRQGFGNTLALGTIGAAAAVGRASQEFVSSLVLTRASEAKDYDPRLIRINSLIFATEPRRPIQLLHSTSIPFMRWMSWLGGGKESFLSTAVLTNIAVQFWGGPEAADFSSYSGKALAAKHIQDYGYMKESLVLCDLSWPIYQVKFSDAQAGFTTLESQLLSNVTGRRITEADIIQIGERVFNLQRAILIRQGWGGRTGDSLLSYLHEEPLQSIFFNRDCIVPGKDDARPSLKGCVVEKTEFETMKDEYYQLRGWDVATGLQTRAKMDELGLCDVADTLARLNLLK